MLCCRDTLSLPIPLLAHARCVTTQLRLQGKPSARFPSETSACAKTLQILFDLSSMNDVCLNEQLDECKLLLFRAERADGVDNGLCDRWSFGPLL